MWINRSEVGLSVDHIIIRKHIVFTTDLIHLQNSCHIHSDEKIFSTLRQDRVMSTLNSTEIPRLSLILLLNYSKNVHGHLSLNWVFVAIRFIIKLISIFIRACMLFLIESYLISKNFEFFWQYRKYRTNVQKRGHYRTTSGDIGIIGFIGRLRSLFSMRRSLLYGNAAGID